MPEAMLFLPVCHYCCYSLANNNNYKLNEQNITHANPQAMDFTFSCSQIRSPHLIRTDHLGMWGRMKAG